MPNVIRNPQQTYICEALLLRPVCSSVYSCVWWVYWGGCEDGDGSAAAVGLMFKMKTFEFAVRA